MNNAFKGLGFYPADILLPREDINLARWAVVACDQYTSQPEYWQRVEDTVGEAPSALRLILPENHLNSDHVDQDIQRINQTMVDYQNQGLFRLLKDSLVYVRRGQSNGKIRKGLVGMVDLEEYDYRPGASSLIRATEGTVLSRIPPRVAVRKQATLELPHVMVLIDDRDKCVLEPLEQQTDVMEPLYNFDLMEQSGHISGWKLTDDQLVQVAEELRKLQDPQLFSRKYEVEGKAVLPYAVGDGNHSLATAKTVYEQLKAEDPAGAELARYALVELVNLHDESLEFEPIHRVVFDVNPEQALEDLLGSYPGAFVGEGEGHQIRFVYGENRGTITIPNPTAQLAVGTLQSWLDGYLKAQGGTVDYIHGDEVVEALANQENTLGFLLPPMEKDALFRTVICDGVLPRKTFSMGEAGDKRFYLEARKIR